jgi:hypothetical protein
LDAIIPVNVGDELGIFKKHGLNLKVVDFGGDSKMVRGMAAGTWGRLSPCGRSERLRLARSDTRCRAVTQAGSPEGPLLFLPRS